jgi:hypothetical protein
MKIHGPSTTGERMLTLPCGTTEIDLLMLLYGETDGSAGRALDEHTRGCAVCAAVFEFLSTRTIGIRRIVLRHLGPRVRVVSAAPTLPRLYEKGH